MTTPAGPVSAGGGNVSAGGSGVSAGGGSVTVGDQLTAKGGGVSVTPDRINPGNGTVAAPGVSASGTAPTIDRNGPSGGGGTVKGPGGISAGGNSGSPPSGGVSVPGGGSIIPGGTAGTPGGVPGTSNPLGAAPRLGIGGDPLLGSGPPLGSGGGAGTIPADSPDALRPAALGAGRTSVDAGANNPAENGRLTFEGLGGVPGRDFPAGILGVDPARAVAIAASEGGGGLLTPAALVAAQVPNGDAARATIIGDIGNALGAVIDGLPDWSKPIIVILLALVLTLGVRALWNGRRARLFRARYQEETEKNAVLQAALVPNLPEHLGGVELSVHYRPADGDLACGGDFYDAFVLGENRVGFLIGDVSGHDRRAIKRAEEMRGLLRSFLKHGYEPRHVLRAAGEALMLDDTLDGDFATAAVAVHDTEAGTLTYACAGHPAPIFVGGAEHEPVSVCSSPALGWGLSTGRRQTTVHLAGADIACFYTDGLIESRFKGGFLGREGLADLVAGLGHTGTARQLLDHVIERAHEADDDLAALVMRASTPTSPCAVRVEELEINEHDVRRSAPARFLAACGAPDGVIEQLAMSAEAAVAETGCALLTVRFDPEADDITAAVEALETEEAPRRVLDAQPA